MQRDPKTYKSKMGYNKTWRSNRRNERLKHMMMMVIMALWKTLAEPVKISFALVLIHFSNVFSDRTGVFSDVFF